jgi:hypothetical protein
LGFGLLMIAEVQLIFVFTDSIITLWARGLTDSRQKGYIRKSKVDFKTQQPALKYLSQMSFLTA